MENQQFILQKDNSTKYGPHRKIILFLPQEVQDGALDELNCVIHTSATKGQGLLTAFSVHNRAILRGNKKLKHPNFHGYIYDIHIPVNWSFHSLTYFSLKY